MEKQNKIQWLKWYTGWSKSTILSALKQWGRNWKIPDYVKIEKEYENGK